MTVVSKAHFELVRARKGLEKAFDENDWQALRVWDAKLGECLNDAFDDDQRDTLELVQEMERVLQTYANLVRSLPENEMSSLSSFPRVF